MRGHKHFDAFLSHNSIDKPWASMLKDALQAKGLKVWLDRDEIRPGDLFVGALEAGLEESKSVVLIVSPESLQSGWVNEEYSRALSLAQQKAEPLQLIPLILRESTLPGFLANRNWVDFRDTARFEVNVECLVWGITGLKPEGSTLAQPRRLISEDSPPATKPLFHNLPQPEYGSFIGREKEIAQITRILRPYPYSQHALVTIDGIGGIGKTALALEVAHRHLRKTSNGPTRQQFGAIIWVSARQSILTGDGIQARTRALRTVQDLYSAVATVLHQDEKMRLHPDQHQEIIHQALTRQRTLIIVDNLETVDDQQVLEFLRDLPAPSKAIVTTRHRIDVAYPIRLVGMDRDDARLLIAQECKKKLVTLTPDDNNRLYDRTGGVPLAIVWSVAQVGWGHTIAGVLDRLGKPNSDIARFCFDRAIGSLRGKPSHRLLMALSYFDRASRELLGYMTALPELDRDDGLVELEKLSLINHDSDLFTMLPLTRGYVKAELEIDAESKADLEGKYQQWMGTVPFHKVIGIDFGSTYSRVAVWDNIRGEVVIIPSLTGVGFIPSVISVDFEGKVTVGARAEANLVHDPTKVVVDIKRSMGLFDSGRDQPGRLSFCGREYLPQQLAAFILAELKRQAERYIGEPIRDAVITVPAYFREAQRSAIQDAAKIANLNVRRLLNEPTAAAVGFGVDKVKHGQRHLYAVYDLGGGTFDISIIAIQEDQVQVLGTSGDASLGGRDFDNRLANYVLEEIAKGYGVDLRENVVARARIVGAAESAKKQLSASPTAVISLPFIAEGLSVTIQVTRSVFESLIIDLVRKTLDRVDSAITLITGRGEEIEQVLLVGGSTRIPLIRKAIASHLGMAEKDVRVDLNPDEAVARGACIVSRVFEPSSTDDKPETTMNVDRDATLPTPSPPAFLVREVASRTLGILVANDAFHPVIPKNSELPIQATVDGFTNPEFANTLQVLIFEGEDPKAFNNAYVGTISFPLEPRPLGYHRLSLMFSLDESGLLEVKVVSVRDGLVLAGTLMSGSRLTPEQIDQEVLHVQKALAPVPVWTKDD